MSRRDGNLTPVQVAAALVRRHDCYLITQRPRGTHLEGLWEFPGGKLDPGETLEECLVREVEEETGLRIQVEHKAGEIIHRYPDRTVQLHFFLAQPLEGEARALGCAAVAWVRAEELLHYPFPPADAQIIDELICRQGGLIAGSDGGAGSFRQSSDAPPGTTP